MPVLISASTEDTLPAATNPRSQLSQPDSLTPCSSHLKSTIYAMILVGASLNAPKARLILELENFDIRPFGWRDDDDGRSSSHHTSGIEDVDALADTFVNASITSGEDGDEDSSDAETSFADISLDSAATAETDESEDGESEVSYAHSVDDEDEISDEHGEDDKAKETRGIEFDIALATPSRKVTEPPFDVSSQPQDDVEINPLHPDCDLQPPPASTAPPASTIERAITPPPPPPSNSGISPPSTTSPADPQPLQPTSSTFTSTTSPFSLLTAERLIYRTLAAPPSAPHSDAEEDDDTELPLSSTTFLIRAPRRFKHDAFLPRQTHSKELNSALDEYLSPPIAKLPKKKGGGMLSKKVGASGLRVSCRLSDTSAADAMIENAKSASKMVVERNREDREEKVGDGDDDDDDDEMIWWEWRGKIKGIGDELFSC